MALKTLGTSATTTLNAIVMNTDQTVADAASIRNTILWDGVQANAIYPGAFEFTGGQGLLYVPRRGWLNVFPGDYIGVDPNGWPILVSKNSIAGSGWTHS